jgi:hypothetical protein
MRNQKAARSCAKYAMSGSGHGPEKCVEQEVLLWLHASGFIAHVYESKAQWSGAAQRFCRQVLPKGHPDILAWSAEGHPVAIELKAPGRRSTLRDDQRIFLKDLIAHNVFAVVVDNCLDLESCFTRWLELDSPSERQEYLLGLLPKEKHL